MLDPGDSLVIHGYLSVFHARNRRGGGSAVLVRDDVRAQRFLNDRLENLCVANNVEVSAVSLDISNHRTIYIFFIYSPPRSGSNFTDRNFWEEFFREVAKSEHGILVGDFILRMQTCGRLACRDPTLRGKRWSRRLCRLLLCLNDSAPTWCSSDASSRSILDLVFASESIALSFEFEVINNTYGSDHFPVMLSSGGLSRTDLPSRPTIRTKKMNW